MFLNAAQIVSTTTKKSASFRNKSSNFPWKHKISYDLVCIIIIQYYFKTAYYCQLGIYKMQTVFIIITTANKIEKKYENQKTRNS